jgi:hypothetical protein
LFTEFAETIKMIMGSALKFRAFYPDGLLRCVIVDAEAAQALGFGDWLVQYNNPEISGIQSRDPATLVMHVMKTCVFHYDQ